MSRRLQETERFYAQSEDGARYTVVEWVTLVAFQSINGPPREAKGARSWSLADGSAVNFNDDGTYEIVDTGEILRRI